MFLTKVKRAPGVIFDDIIQIETAIANLKLNLARESIGSQSVKIKGRITHDFAREILPVITDAVN